MWFLVQTPTIAGSRVWRYVAISQFSLDMDVVKRAYRAAGIPIIAIARRKPKPDVPWDASED